MRIAILAVQSPFARGGAEIHVESLRREIQAAGHVVDVVTVPFNDIDGRSLLASCAAWRSLNLEELPDGPIDRVIATKFPSYLASHPHKVVWLFHQYRGAYDCAGTSYSNLRPDRLPDEALRETLLDMDRRALGECRKIFTTSRNVSERLLRYNGIESRCLYHPPPLAGRMPAVKYGGFVLGVSRLERNKRLDLLIEAMAQTRSGIRCVIVGSGSQEPHLRFLTEQYGLTERVRFAGAVDDAELIQLYSDCRGVFFAPFDEDYGYVTLEAFWARKPVVTSLDSGGVLEFVEDGETGFVVEPNPAAIARSIDRLADDADLARRLGESGYQRVSSITWAGVINTLLDEK